MCQNAMFLYLLCMLSGHLNEHSTLELESRLSDRGIHLGFLEVVHYLRVKYIVKCCSFQALLNSFSLNQIGSVKPLTERDHRLSSTQHNLCINPNFFQVTQNQKQSIHLVSLQHIYINLSLNVLLQVKLKNNSAIALSKNRKTEKSVQTKLFLMLKNIIPIVECLLNDRGMFIDNGEPY